MAAILGEEAVKQVFELINTEAKLGNMQPKSTEQIRQAFLEGRAFITRNKKKVTSVCIYYEHLRFVEIGSIVVRPDYRGRKLAQKVARRAISRARFLTPKSLMAVVREEGIHFFKKFGFSRVDLRVNGIGPKEPCKEDCRKIGRWPTCNCCLMLLEM